MFLRKKCPAVNKDLSTPTDKLNTRLGTFFRGFLLIRDQFDILVAGNYEQQAAAGLTTCGCGYASEEDECIGGIIFEHALTAKFDE